MMQRPTFRHRLTRPAQSGAAILIAMLIMVLITTVAAGTLWRQHQVMGVEIAERERAQAIWVLNGLLDWARIIISEDDRPSASNGNPRRVDYLDEPWAKELKASSLSAFLAIDKDDSADRDSSDISDAFFSGKFQDLNAKFNLPDLLTDDLAGYEPNYNAVFNRLCAALDIVMTECSHFKAAYLEAARRNTAETSSSAQTDFSSDRLGVPVLPNHLDQLDWLGVNQEILQRLRPYLVIFSANTFGRPRQRQTININTANAVMLKAAIDGCDDNCAQQIRRLSLSPEIKGFANAEELFARQEFKSLAERNEAAPIDGKSQLFLVMGRLQIDKLIVEEQAMLWRPNPGQVQLYHRERRALGSFAAEDSEDAIGVDDLESFYKNQGNPL